MKIVEKIIENVKKNGDIAIKKYTEKFDKIKLDNIEVTKEEIKKAYAYVDKELLSELKNAARNIKSFCKKQLPKGFEIKKQENILGQKIIPLERVGCYVPGGRYPLPSSALMSVIPAKTAGVKEIILCSPKIRPETIVAANLAGANRIFNIGGVQAIAAMTYGTKTIPKVDKIVGPGNKYVAEAKRQVFGQVGIDFIAGPSELLIIADDSSNLRFIAADILAQAEHDPDARCYLVTTSEKIKKEIKKEIDSQLSVLKTNNIARIALKNFKIFKVKTLTECMKIANKIAPEHLSLQVKNPKKITEKLTNYGSLFIGKDSAVAFGDYCSGTNHILPTNGTARFSSGLSTSDFVKVVSYQKIVNPSKLRRTAIKLAETEGLDAHRKSIEIRTK